MHSRGKGMPWRPGSKTSATPDLIRRVTVPQRGIKNYPRRPTDIAGPLNRYLHGYSYYYMRGLRPECPTVVHPGFPHTAFSASVPHPDRRIRIADAATIPKLRLSHCPRLNGIPKIELGLTARWQNSAITITLARTAENRSVRLTGWNMISQPGRNI